MIRSHKIRLDPNAVQEEFFRKCVGTARFAFNWALSKWREQYAAKEKPTEGRLRKSLNAIKSAEFPWMAETPKSVVQQAIKNLGTAYQNFFASCSGKRSGPKMSPPDFKCKDKSRQSARLDNGPGTFSFDGGRVKLPKIGWVKCFESLRLEGKPLSATLRYEAGRWFVAVQVELPDPAPAEQGKPSVGVDLGLTSTVALSTGEKYDSPKPLRSALERLRRLGRWVSRKVKGSQNRKKAARLLGRQHWRIAQIRKDWQHKTTTVIAKRFGLVCIEDLNVKGMMANHHLARAISDVGWAEIGRQLSYKCDKVQEVGRFYPSSKTCSGCGTKVEDMLLDVRTWTCHNCGEVHDRDINAALNIEREGQRLYTASCVVINACGDGSSGPNREIQTKLPSMKQESSQIRLVSA